MDQASKEWMESEAPQPKISSRQVSENWFFINIWWYWKRLWLMIKIDDYMKWTNHGSGALLLLSFLNPSTCSM